MASLACAVHCALMPLALSLLPLLGSSVLGDESLEWGLVLLSMLLGIASLTRGYHQHGSRRALFVLGLGLVFLVLGRVWEVSWGSIPAVLGGLIVALAHFMNHRLTRCPDKPVTEANYQVS